MTVPVSDDNEINAIDQALADYYNMFGKNNNYKGKFARICSNYEIQENELCEYLGVGASVEDCIFVNELRAENFPFFDECGCVPFMVWNIEEEIFNVLQFCFLYEKAPIDYWDMMRKLVAERRRNI